MVGYPNLVEDPQRWPATQVVSGRCSGIRASDVGRLRGATGYMNQTLKVVTEEAEHESVTFRFVDINGQVYETNEGRHGLCSDDPWLNDALNALRARRIDRAFHPNDRGHAGMAKHLSTIIEGLNWMALEEVPVPGAPLQPDPSSTDESILTFDREGIGSLKFGRAEPPALVFLTDIFGDAGSDSGWVAHQCTAVGEERTLSWDVFGLTVYLSRDASSEPYRLASWTLERSEGGDHIQTEYGLFNRTWSDIQLLVPATMTSTKSSSSVSTNFLVNSATLPPTMGVPSSP